MAVPKFNELMLPLLEIASDDQKHHVRDVMRILAKGFNLSDDDLNELLPSGQQTRFENRVYWAKTHLSKAGLLESAGKSVV